LKGKQKRREEAEGKNKCNDGIPSTEGKCYESKSLG